MIVGRHSLPLQTCAIVASHDICAVVTTAAVVLRTLVNICEVRTFDRRVAIFIRELETLSPFRSNPIEYYYQKFEANFN